MMLAAEVHLCTKNCDFLMEHYVFKRHNDDIIVQSVRPYGQRAVLKFSQYTGAHAIAGRHTPVTFTNQLQTSLSEPRLLILTDLRTDHQPIKESSLGNVPTITFCDTDSPMRYVDIGIPANNKGKHSIGCLFWLLARVVLQMRGTIPQGHKWNVMVDLFFYREPEETKEQEEEEAVAIAGYALPAADFGLASADWGAQIIDGQWNVEAVPPPISTVPAAVYPDQGISYSNTSKLHLIYLVILFIYLQFFAIPLQCYMRFTMLVVVILAPDIISLCVPTSSEWDAAPAPAPAPLQFVAAVAPAPSATRWDE
ncbi:hypothetical protein MANES_11G014701v8 [Manihot esculenta]|uniref:Uncharacterized protein n=1 Tax=Manihot esculenta TaxID=3983 RepID=A0ACB7GS17_MANES|nr:hypothetical protein MANES_11G014701v8 [Manihot esculenta]